MASLKPGFFRRWIEGWAIGHITQIGHQVGIATVSITTPGRTGNPLQGARTAHQRIEQLLSCAAENGVVENAGQLRGNGDQKGPSEAKWRIVVCWTNTTPSTRRYWISGTPSKGVVALFANVANRVEARVTRGVLQIQRLLSSCHQPDQTLPPVQLHPSNRLRIETGSRHQAPKASDCLHPPDRWYRRQPASHSESG